MRFSNFQKAYEKYSPTLDRIPNLNYGGCGYVAYTFARNLQDYLNIKIAMVTAWHNSVYDTEKYRDNNGIMDIGKLVGEHGICHVICVVKNRGKLYGLDSEYFQEFTTVKNKHRKQVLEFHDRFYVCDGFLSVQEMGKMVRTKHYWNDDYNRKNNPRVCSLIGKMVSYAI